MSDIFFRVNSSSKTRQSSIVHRLFGSDVELLIRCRCGKETKRESTTLLFNLEYPELPTGKIWIWMKRGFIKRLTVSGL